MQRSPSFPVCISKKNHTCALVRPASVLGVHVLDNNGPGIAELFGGETGDEVDKFARVIGTPGLALSRCWMAAGVGSQVSC